MSSDPNPDDRWPPDWDYPRAVLAGLVLAVVVAIAVAGLTSTAAFGAYNPQWDGAADLRGVATDAGADATIVRNTSEYRDAPADRTVALVLSPERAYGERDRARLRRFVRSGGTLVVAEDYGDHGNGLLAAVGAEARFDGTPVRDERHNYRSPAMPVARNVGNHSLTEGVDALTLNHGTVVEPNGARPIVNTSEYAYLDANRNDGLEDDETLQAHPVATVEAVGEGRVVAVSDPSLFINAMLERPGNRQFARNLFGAHDRVLLDYSHGGSLPPLAVGLLVARGVPLVQMLLLATGLGLVAAWGGGLFAPLWRRLTDTGQDVVGGDESLVGEETLVLALEREHPDWDEARLRRVTKGVLRSGEESEADD